MYPSRTIRLFFAAAVTAAALCCPSAPAASAAEAASLPAMQDYAKSGELDPLPAGTASLYGVPWRSNVRTVSAAGALEGVGVYYKHVPNDWTPAQHAAVMKQLAAAGVRRLRLAPHHTIYITQDWKAPRDVELASLRNELGACKAAGIRPCVVFVHIPPVGRPGTRELQEWWRQGELLPPGEVGSPEFQAYLDKTYEALGFILREARAAGFDKPGSYDLEMGQGLWWGAPAVPRPLPSTTLDALRPGGRIHEFDRALIRRLRADGFREPTLWWGQTHHHFEDCRDADVPPQCAGRAVSFYSGFSGTVPKTWLERTLFDRPPGPNDVWPVRRPLRFAQGAPPGVVLARPESWAADRTRRDNLIALLRAAKSPVCIPSLGTVPGEIPPVQSGPLNGWQIKQRALGRTLAFWLNQGAAFVLLHSAYEPGAKQRGEMAHSLIPNPIDPLTFRREDAPPLVTLRAFCDALEGGQAVEKPDGLSFRYALSPDPVLIGASGQAGPLTGADAVALLTFQLAPKRFAVAAYVVSPNVAQPLAPMRMTLEVGRRLTGAGAATFRPYTGAKAPAEVLRRAGHATVLRFDLYDDVTWLTFQTE